MSVRESRCSPERSTRHLCQLIASIPRTPGSFGSGSYEASLIKRDDWMPIDGPMQVGDLQLVHWMRDAYSQGAGHGTAALVGCENSVQSRNRSIVYSTA